MNIQQAVGHGWSLLANATAGHRHPHTDLTKDEWTLYLGISVALVLLAGLMSGLTLGLMSINVLDMEVSWEPFLLAQPASHSTMSWQTQLSACTS